MHVGSSSVRYPRPKVPLRFPWVSREIHCGCDASPLHPLHPCGLAGCFVGLTFPACSHCSYRAPAALRKSSVLTSCQTQSLRFSHYNIIRLPGRARAVSQPCAYTHNSCDCSGEFIGMPPPTEFFESSHDTKAFLVWLIRKCILKCFHLCVLDLGGKTANSHSWQTVSRTPETNAPWTNCYRKRWILINLLLAES